MISGRISQVAVFPDSPSHYLVAEASSNIFLTTNNGTTWTPVFDNYGSYSIGGITIDPKNPSTVWVGTGENNNQRSVSFGDGVYKSEDGGRTYRYVGLKLTEHIARIVIDPRDSNVVYVAAPGPLWKGGGERGLYKTTDGGKTWSQSLIKVDDYTGCSDVLLDPQNPDIVFAATHQRQRSYFGMIHGGPGSALWRSTDAGKTWNKVAVAAPAANSDASVSTGRPPLPIFSTRRSKPAKAAAASSAPPTAASPGSAATHPMFKDSITLKSSSIPPTPTASTS